MNGLEILDEALKRFVQQQRLGFVATVSPSGKPNLSPKRSLTVWDDSHLVFADIHSPGTLANLRRNPAVEINVVDPIFRKGYRFKGEGTKGPLFKKNPAFYEQDEQAGGDRIRGRARAIVLVRIRRVIPLTSPEYDLGVSEEEVKARREKYWTTNKRIF